MREAARIVAEKAIIKKGIKINDRVNLLVGWLMVFNFGLEALKVEIICSLMTHQTHNFHFRITYDAVLGLRVFMITAVCIFVSFLACWLRHSRRNNRVHFLSHHEYPCKNK